MEPNGSNSKDKRVRGISASKRFSGQSRGSYGVDNKVYNIKA